MKLIFTLFAVFISNLFFCQDIKVLDFNTNQPIENVTVSLDEKFIGYSDSNGGFRLNEDIKYSIISFSHLNYKTLVVEKERFTESIIYLVSKLETLDEIEIEAKKKYSLARGLLGGTGILGGRTHLGWDSKAVTFIPFQEEGIISKLKYRLVDMLGVKGLKYLKFKANLYTIDTITRLPKKKLLKEDILTSNKNGERIFSIDISNYNIQMPKEGVFVAFIILGYDEYEVKGVMSKGGRICATPAIKTRVRKNKEKRFSLKYTKGYYDSKLTNKWNKIDDYFYVMGLEIKQDK